MQFDQIIRRIYAGYLILSSLFTTISAGASGHSGFWTENRFEFLIYPATAIFCGVSLLLPGTLRIVSFLRIALLVALPVLQIWAMFLLKNDTYAGDWLFFGIFWNLLLLAVNIYLLIKEIQRLSHT